MPSMLFIVTGASRGLGQAIATSAAENHDGTLTHLRAVLISRSSCDETELRMQEAAASKQQLKLEVTKHAMDLSNLDKLDSNIDNLLTHLRLACPYDRILFVSNAGSLGHLGPVTELHSLQDFRKYIDFNVTSSLWLFSRLLQALAVAADVTMVNISSLCAIQPFTNMASYCAGKAARDMFHSVAATELQKTNIKTLNYAPGALDTVMTTQLRSSPGFEGGVAGPDLIPPLNTARRLIKLVMKNQFETGSHIDYWDLNDQGDIVVNSNDPDKTT